MIFDFPSYACILAFDTKNFKGGDYVGSLNIEAKIILKLI
jgi:hypothetical protein